MAKKLTKKQVNKMKKVSAAEKLERRYERREIAVKEGAEMAILNHMALTLYALRTRFGFSKVRLQRFHDEMIKHARDFNAGVFNYQDIVNEMEHETGFNLSTFLSEIHDERRCQHVDIRRLQRG